MTYTEILEIAVCVLAVYGFYAIVCHLIAFVCPKGDFSVGVHVKRGEKLTPQENMQCATVLTENFRGHLRPPVFLLDEPLDRETELMLTELGYRIYRLTNNE